MDGCDMTNLPCGLTAAGPECEHGPPDLCLPQSEENVSLQLLEFKAHLLELIEELHIRRDAEERFEEQRNKIVLEKQELEWEKKSLQHQIESEKNHYAESLSKANKQFQETLRNIEEEKNKYQVNSEQKDKDIQNLKEELKSLQLTKYNLEKKSSELEQKLTLQSRSKDSRLNQLSDVEKRFSALSRQCSMVKQAHGKLEQNVDEAMKLNKKLISTNETQLVTIASLNKEVEELRSKLVKTKMTSVISEKRTDHPSIKEQTVNQLQLRLNMECEMNRKYKNENKVLQAEKQEVLTSLQIAHQLLSKQTQTMSRLELDLEAQRKQYQSLEQDHKAMREKEKTAEDQIKQLMEECTVSKSSWDKEKADFLEQMKKEKQELTSVKEAFEELRQNHTELSSKAEEQAQLISELTINVKELDLVIPSNNTQDGIDSVSKIDVSGGHAVYNENYMNDINSELKANSPISNADNCPPASALRETTSELTNSCTMDDASADVETSTVSQACETQLNFSATSTYALEFQSLQLDTKNTFQENGDSVEKAHKATEEKDVHVQENCEESTKNGAEDTDLSHMEEHAQTTHNPGEQSVIDHATPTLRVLKEIAAKTGVEFTLSERQPQLDEEENLPHVIEDTRNETQISAFDIVLQSTTNEKVNHVLPLQKMRRADMFPGDSIEQVCKSKHVKNSSPLVKTTSPSVCHDLEESTVMVSAESITAELPKPLNKSSSCQSQSDAAQLDSVSIQETTTMQTQMVSPSDTPGHVKDTVDESAKECSPVNEIVEDTVGLVSQKELSENNNLTNLVRGTSHDLTNHGEKRTDREQVDIMDKCKQSGVDKNTDSVDSWDEFERFLKLSKMPNKDRVHWSKESDLKADFLKSQLSGASDCKKNIVAEESKMSEFFVPLKTTYKPLFEWGSAQRRAQSSSASSGTSAHSVLLTSSQMSSTSDYLSSSSSTISICHKGKYSKVPLTITRAADLLSCGTTATSSGSHLQTECRALGEAHMDTTAQMDSRGSPSDAASLVSASSSALSRPQTKRTLSPDARGTPESEWGPGCSQDTEEQQSSFRTQISKIEQFLNTERLRLPKRRKTDN
ncbi:unnamed protein product [Knipowitschia caucasica]